MVVDGKGKIFEDRRKLDDRRTKKAKIKNEKRKVTRRKEESSNTKQHGK